MLLKKTITINMKKNPGKIKTVMHEFKSGNLHSGKSGQIVKNPKQAIAIALSEAGMTKKKYATGGLVENSSSTKTTGGPKSDYARDINFSAYTQNDGYLKGGIDVEMTAPNETQEQPVRGQRRMMTDKRKIAKWF